MLLAFVMIFGSFPATALAGEFAGIQIQAISQLSAEEIYEGLFYSEKTVLNDAGKDVNTFVITVDTTNENLSFLAGTPNDESLKPGGRQSTSGQAKAAYGNGRNVVAAINADYFNINDDTLIQPMGLTIKDGELLVGPHKDRYFFGVKKDGTPVIGNKTLYESISDDLQQAVGGRYLILDGDKPTTHQDSRAPRTAIGITTDNKVIMVVADGRTDASAGFYLSEMGAYLKSLGAVIGLELDGGGSSASVVRTPGTSDFVVKNSPSDGSERPVGDTLLVIYDDPNIEKPSLDKDADGYYLIRNAEDMDEIKKSAGSNYRLADDIDFSGVSVTPGSSFSGILDGAGHTISNLSITSDQSVALFSDLLSRGKIHNLNFADANLKSTSSGNVAYTSLVGINYGTIDNVHFSGSLTGNGYVAPFAGTQEATGIVKNSSSSVIISATGPNVSGAVGWNKGGSMHDVTVTGKISGNRYVGGIAGDFTSDGQILRCSVGAVINGSGTRVGGIAGNIAGNSSIEQSYANVIVKSNDCVGGIVGYADGTNVTIRNNIVEGSVEAAKEPGGIGGLLKVRTINNVVKGMTVKSTGTGTVASGNVAGLLGAWSNGANPYFGNVILSGAVITTAQGEAHRLGYHNDNKSQNYVNPSVTINGQPETGGLHNNRIGADATMEQLTSKSFFEGLGFDFSSVFDWDIDENTLFLRDVNQTVEPSTGKEVGPGEADLKALSFNVGKNQNERNFVWYSNSDDPGFLQYAPASAVINGVFPEEHTNVTAKRNSGVGDYFAYSAETIGLAPDTEYAYRVGNEDRWSETYTFNTESSKDFSFLFAGDPQIGSSGNADKDTAGWNSTLRKAENWFAGVNFMISAGDQVENATYEGQYDGFLSPNNMRSLALATNIGNHDSGSDIYKKHFNLPNKTSLQGDTEAGGNYWYSYNGVLFMAINSNNISTAQHKAFLEGAIQSYKDQNGGEDPGWKIVTLHHSIYSTASHTTDSDIIQRRNELPPIFSELGIDAVLMGHDHVYTRSLMMNGTTPVTEGYTAGGDDQYASYTKESDSKEVFYLTANSASGSKFYKIKNLDFPFRAADNQENVPNITKIDVSENTLKFTTYRAGESNSINDVVDTFTLNRVEASPQPSIITDGLPEGKTGVSYGPVTLESRGEKPITWSISSGHLPEGLTLSEYGIISGTPAASAKGVFEFTVKAENNTGLDTKDLSIKIGEHLDTDVDGYYLIRTAEDVEEIRKSSDSNYRLANDIDLSGVSIMECAAFRGILDGADHTISNLNIESDKPVALFAELTQTGKIHNLKFANANLKYTGLSGTVYTSLVGINKGIIENVHFSGKLTGNGYVAPFAGTQEATGTVKNSTSNVVVSANGANISGAVGWNKGGNIYDVTVTGIISGDRYVGGIAGDFTLNDGRILRCSVGAVINASGTRVGGIAGNIQNNGVVDSSYANVIIKANDRAGGIVGFANTGSTVKNSIAEGSVQATKETGGVGGALLGINTNNIVRNLNVISIGTGTPSDGNIAGLLGASIDGTNYTGNVILSGSITMTEQGEAHRIGYHDKNKSQNYVNSAVTINGKPETGGLHNNRIGADVTLEQLTNKNFFEQLGFDFTSVFDWDMAEQTPVLRNVDQNVKPSDGTGTGSGEADIKDVVINIGRDQYERNFAWYSNSDDPGFLQYVPASDVVNDVFPEKCVSVSAKRTLGSGEYYSYRAEVTGLVPDTKYAYRAGNEDGWSQIFTFTTDKSGDFSFLFAGDPQIGSSGDADKDKTGWNNALEKAAGWFRGVNLMITAGDQVETASNEREYDGFLSPLTMRSLALAPNIGNHDSGSDIYKRHFNLPNATSLQGDTAAGGNYWYSYNGVLFMAMNSNNISTAQHKAFLKNAVQEYKDQNGGKDPLWKIVTLHHSIYSTASHTSDTDILQRRDELPLVFSEFGIDAVLMGHDHVYTRSLMMNGTKPVTEGYTAKGSDQYASYSKAFESKEVFYLTANSASGSKFYKIKNLDFPFRAFDNQENVPNISKIDVSENSLIFTTYRAGANNSIDDVVDTFTLNREAVKQKPVITTTVLPEGTVGISYFASLEADGDCPITWSKESGELPEGLILSEEGIISGTPTASAIGAFDFTVKATNIIGSDKKELSIKIGEELPTGVKPTIYTSSLPVGRTESPYGPVTLNASGDKPITWSVRSGKLPEGLTISEEGIISGTPTASAIGVFDFTIKAENNVGYDTKNMNIEIKRKSNGNDGGSNGNGGTKTPVVEVPETEKYTAKSKINGVELALKVIVDEGNGRASVDLSTHQEDMFNGGADFVTIPYISGVDKYSISIPVSSLSTIGKQGELRLNTYNGNITVPSNMLTRVAGTSGNKAEITIGKGNMSRLPESAKASVGDRQIMEVTLVIDGRHIQWNNSDTPLTLSTTYKPTDKENKNLDSIIIWYVDNKGGATPTTDGYYDPAAGVVRFTTTNLGLYAIGYNPVKFGDVDEEEWYYKPISFIAARKIAAGTGNGNFSPDAKITRGEFIVMMMKSYGITEDNNLSNNFSDAGSTYYTGYLAAAKKLGISSGVGGNMFAPDKEITRQEMFTMLYKALKMIDRLPEGKSGKLLSDFADSEIIESWAEEAISMMVESGNITGSAGKINPQDMTSRAEMAQVLYNLLSK